MSIVLNIGGVDRTEWLAPDTLRYTMQLNARATAECTLEDKGRGYLPVVGQVLEVVDSGTKRFGGIIQQVTRRVHPGTSSAQFSVSAVDYSSICDRRIMVGNMVNQTLGDMVGFIAGIALNGEGISLAGVATGPLIEEQMNWNYVSVTEAFNKLSQVTGYLWYIDANKVLYFSLFASNPAPFSITDSSANWRDLEVVSDLSDYRNRQYARTEYNVHETFRVALVSDGATRDYFTGSFILNTLPTVTVNGTAQTVGRLGPDGPPGAFDCFYDVNGVGVHWFAPTAPPAAGEIVITARMDYPNVTMVEDTAEIAARAAVEGGSGRYEAIEENRNVDTLGALQAMATGALRMHGEVPTVVTYTTQTTGLAPGMRQSISNTILLLGGTFLIERVEVRCIRAAASDVLETRITATSVERYGRATGFLEKLVENARIGPGAANVPDDLLVSIDASAGPVTYTLPSYLEFPGRVIRVFKVDSSNNAVTIQAPSGESINSDSSVTLSQQYESFTFQSSAS